MTITTNKHPEIKVLLLATDPELLCQVTDAVEDHYALFHANELKQALSFEQLGQVAVLIADVDLLTDNPGTVLERLQRRAPAMLPVIAGPASELDKFKAMMAEGKIFRVLGKPCQPGQTRLYVEAAVKQAMRDRGVDHQVEKKPVASWKKPALIAGGAAAVILSVALVVLGGTGRESDSTGQAALIEHYFDQARTAMSQERYLEPKKDNAIFFYQQVLKLEPDNVSAQASLSAVADQLMIRTEQDLLDNRTDQAARAITMVRIIRPDHPRLAFFDSLVVSVFPEQRLENARQAIDSGQYEHAFGLLAESSAGGSAVPVDLETAVLGGALAHAQEAIANGQISQALDLIDRVRVIDPGYGQLSETDRLLARKYTTLLADVDKETNRENYLAAERLLKQAEIIPGSNAATIRRARIAIADGKKVTAEKAVVMAAEKTHRDRIENRVQALNLEFKASLADERLLEPRQGNARYFLEEMRRLDPQSEAYVSGSLILSNKFIGNMREEILAREFEAAEKYLKSAENLAANPALVESARAEFDKGFATYLATNAIPVSQMEMINFVHPNYPKRALRRNVQGWVDVEFTVSASGEVSGIEIIATDRSGYFENAAKKAVAKWQFEPQIYNDEPISQRVAARLRFKL
jgi:TonB family protein